MCLTNSTMTIFCRTRLKVFACHSVCDVVIMSLGVWDELAKYISAGVFVANLSFGLCSLVHR